MVQDNNNYCICAILSDILINYNIIVPQKEIAKNLTPAKNGFRVDDDNIKQFLKKNNFDYNFYWWDKTPFNEPYMLLKEMHNNQGFIGIGDHAYRVLEFEDPIIVVLDPANDYPRDFGYDSLMYRLKQCDGGFGLIKKLK